ncbi:Uncharacterised protein [Mycobacterium tuberculosis]|uniref:Uncharacterized protein n=1 Tax=Mycobacterium tuberculosis TaxID=1773 RepID=A0A916PAE6_MYCTX|nr:Uncharacterised protein [Mycobacterium tuberculosis]COW96691.1 Uncharacterised protein [Mycobacterium tuberculosis]
MHRGDRLAEPVGFTGEIAADFVGIEVSLGEEVPHAGGGHRPAFGRVRLILGHHAQGVRQSIGWRTIGPPKLVSAQQAGHMWITGTGKHAVQLYVGVDPAAYPAEHLEDSPPIEDHTGVALFGVTYPRLRGKGQLDVWLPGERYFAGGCATDGGRDD